MFDNLKSAGPRRTRQANNTIIYASAELLNLIFNRGTGITRVIDQMHLLPSGDLRMLCADVFPAESLRLDIGTHRSNTSIYNGDRYVSQVRIKNGENLSSIDPYLFSINR